MGAVCACCSCRCVCSPAVANLLYVGMIALATIVAVSLRYSSVDLNIGAVIGTQGVSVCTGSSDCDASAISFTICNSDSCKGYWAVYRIAFVLTGYHLLLCFATACRCRTSALIHHGYWFAKLAFIAVALTGAIFAPNDLFAYFSWVARFVAPVFLIYELILFIDFGYSLNDGLVAKDERQDRFCGCSNDSEWAYKRINLGLAALLFVGSVATLGSMYALWPQDCAFNPLAVTTTLLLGLLNTGIAISSVAEHGSLLTSGLVFAYTTFIAYESLSAMPEGSCNVLHSEEEHIGALVASVIVAGLSLGYQAYRTGSKQIGANAMSGGPSKAPAMELSDLGAGRGNLGSSTPPTEAQQRPDEVTVTVEGEAPSRTAARVAEERLVPSDQNYWSYHLWMAIICAYMSMVLTDWGVPASSGATVYTAGYASAWLQMSMNWLCNLLYLWSLVAPKACPGRDFS